MQPLGLASQDHPPHGLTPCSRIDSPLELIKRHGMLNHRRDNSTRDELDRLFE